MKRLLRRFRRWLASFVIDYTGQALIATLDSIGRDYSISLLKNDACIEAFGCSDDDINTITFVTRLDPASITIEDNGLNTVTYFVEKLSCPV